uniref:Molybdopterin synthase catalytic subunit n=1 Tax=Sinocyclocheilus rhinocerous TaxID=307959 RepID=A0A673NBE1_9TELE
MIYKLQPLTTLFSNILEQRWPKNFNTKDEKSSSIEGMAADGGQDLITLTTDKLSADRVSESVTCPSCGAVSLFIGTTRDNFEGKKVIRLEYEAYSPMAESELRKICREIRTKWPSVRHINIQHRLGVVPITEASVIIGISSPHRRDSLEAVKYCIDTLKATVPIWKKVSKSLRWDRLKKMCHQKKNSLHFVCVI